MKAPKPIPSVEIRYRFTQDMVRMWRTDWGGDQFETLTPDEFDTAKKLFTRFSFVVREAEED